MSSDKNLETDLNPIHRHIEYPYPLNEKPFNVRLMLSLNACYHYICDITKTKTIELVLIWIHVNIFEVFCLVFNWDLFINQLIIKWLTITIIWRTCRPPMPSPKMMTKRGIYSFIFHSSLIIDSYLYSLSIIKL